MDLGQAGAPPLNVVKMEVPDMMYRPPDPLPTRPPVLPALARVKSEGRDSGASSSDGGRGRSRSRSPRRSSKKNRRRGRSRERKRRRSSRSRSRSPSRRHRRRSSRSRSYSPSPSRDRKRRDRPGSRRRGRSSSSSSEESAGRGRREPAQWPKGGGRDSLGNSGTDSPALPAARPPAAKSSTTVKVRSASPATAGRVRAPTMRLLLLLLPGTSRTRTTTPRMSCWDCPRGSSTSRQRSTSTPPHRVSHAPRPPDVHLLLREQES
jgi:hypothetical protein